MSHKREFKKFEDDLEMQERMNLAFIRTLPDTESRVMGKLGREMKEFTVPDVMPSSKIESYEKELEKFK